MLIRRASTKDLPFIQSCHRQSTRDDRFHGRSSRLGPFMPQVEKDALINDAETKGKYTTLMATNRQAAPLGFGRVYHRARDNASTLHKLFVASAARKRGVATGLMNAFKRSASQAGSDKLVVTISSKELLPFYKGQGFKVHSTKKREGKSDLIRMECALR
ncbi:MAG: GNAT family N-acetyltransferase [Alphaproteobacteria bacterium]|nr:GNAT family N-acetyltransferase [Alphaproteobacteria bacterium]